jgi:hypothetical protein
MKSKVIAIAAVLATQLGLAGAANAAFEVYYFEGNRDDVRTGCIGEGDVLLDRGDYSFCYDKIEGASLTCDDDGDCIGTGYTSVADTAERRGRRYGAMIVGEPPASSAN